jgi:hypothetical protein
MKYRRYAKLQASPEPLVQGENPEELSKRIDDPWLVTASHPIGNGLICLHLIHNKKGTKKKIMRWASEEMTRKYQHANGFTPVYVDDNFRAFDQIVKNAE